MEKDCADWELAKLGELLRTIIVSSSNEVALNLLIPC